jgi:predicted NBD/HSP70 family sugar kinase
MEHSVDDVVTDLAALAADLRARGDWPIVGIGVAVAGIVRRSDGVVSMAPNLGWIDVPLGARLARALSVAVPISVVNDADAGVLGEYRRGAAVGVDNVVFVSGEVGVGGGLIVDGRLLTGAAGFAGEIGHVTVNPDGAPCRCGSIGCWETEVGERVLLARAGHAPDEGKDGIDAVLHEAEAGSETALAAIDHVGRWLGIGLGGLINVLNPRLVILGGPNGRLLPLARQRIEATLELYALSASRSQVRIVPATLGVDAPLIGAAEMAFDPLLSDPAAWFGRPDHAVHLASA